MEYFGVKLEGFAFTEAGWVQSYGSRYVRPPIIYGDVTRTGPITVKEFKYAQSLTSKPVKGMLTGASACLACLISLLSTRTAAPAMCSNVLSLDYPPFCRKMSPDQLPPFHEVLCYTSSSC